MTCPFCNQDVRDDPHAACEAALFRLQERVRALEAALQAFCDIDREDGLYTNAAAAAELVQALNVARELLKAPA